MDGLLLYQFFVALWWQKRQKIGLTTFVALLVGLIVTGIILARVILDNRSPSGSSISDASSLAIAFMFITQWLGLLAMVLRSKSYHLELVAIVFFVLASLINKLSAGHVTITDQFEVWEIILIYLAGSLAELVPIFILTLDVFMVDIAQLIGIDPEKADQ